MDPLFLRHEWRQIGRFTRSFFDPRRDGIRDSLRGSCAEGIPAGLRPQRNNSWLDPNLWNALQTCLQRLLNTLVLILVQTARAAIIVVLFKCLFAAHRHEAISMPSAHGITVPGVSMSWIRSHRHPFAEACFLSNWRWVAEWIQHIHGRTAKMCSTCGRH